MIITIDKAILHLCNVIEGVQVLSEQELDITDASINTYITSNIEKTFNSPSCNKGLFNSNSGMKSALIEYEQNKTNLIDLSQFVANRMYEAISSSSKGHNTDVLVTEFISNSKRYIGILKLDSKKEFIHRIMNANGKHNTTVATSKNIMPSSGQSISEFAFICLSDLKIQYSSKRHMIDGEKVDIMADIILECYCETLSSKEANKKITKLVRSLSVDELESTVKLKSEMMKAIKEQKGNNEMEYNLADISSKVFAKKHLSDEFIQCAIKDGIIGGKEDNLSIDDYIIKKTNESIKLVTDNGCEIKFPSYLYMQNNGIEIEEDGNGYKIIKIKGVQEIEVK